MKKYRQKDIKDFVRTNLAEDITGYGFDKMKEFLHSHSLEKIGYSAGIYGINGGLLRDINTGKLYVITARNTALAMAF
ncbi:MAG: hypothetical protein ACLTBR_03310 [Anaerostipes sp.]|uniref:hypothetical protein n=1 Tax=Anaerostipes sp. TaxID=1872530 RepID=UPI003994A65D